jgi:hypothetical protein
MDGVPACVTPLLSVIIAALPGTATETLPQGDRSPSITVPGVLALIALVRTRRLRRS